MNPFIEIKSTGTTKDVDVKSRVVSGYLSGFGNIDKGNDIIEKGAFTKSINERFSKIFFLLQHDMQKPLGKFQVLEEKDGGLYFEAKVSNTTYGNDLLQLYEDGVINEHSIGFNTIKSEKKSGVRIIKEVKLFEGSAVTIGANENTPFLGFKSAIAEISDKQSKILMALKNGNLTDETFIMLEYSLKQLQAEAYELGKNTHEQKEPTIVTPSNVLEPSDIINEFRKSLKN